MRKRNLKIAIVFVWALAHGVWIGAGWHTAEAFQLGAPAADARCTSCRHDMPKSTSESLTEAAANEHCAICQLSTLLPDVPGVEAYNFGSETQEFAAPSQSAGVVRIAPAFSHPPAQAPPSV